jgi:hypothetical protein
MVPSFQYADSRQYLPAQLSLLFRRNNKISKVVVYKCFLSPLIVEYQEM